MSTPDLQQIPADGSSSRVGNYQSRNVIFSVTAALLLIGAFALLAQHTNRLTKVIQSNIEIQLWLENGLDIQDSLRLIEMLSTRPYVVKVDGKPRLTYVSKEEAVQKLSEQLKEDIIKYAGENPLRNYFLINILPEYHRKEQLARIKEELENEPGIFEVSYAPAFIDQIAKNIRTIGFFMLSLALLLIILTAFFVHTAIKLALYSQRFIIRSMQLVGATDFFIKKPFVLRAGLHGTISGMIASVILTGILLWLYKVLPDLKAVEDWLSTGSIFLSLLLAGALIAAGSAYYAVNKYLNRSLDELYRR